MKIAINRCWGGFGLSYEAVMKYAELSGFKLYPIIEKRVKGKIDFNQHIPYIGQKDILFISYLTKPLLEDGTYPEDSYWYQGDIERNDPILIQVIEELGEQANGRFSEIKIVDIPDDVKWQIDDYDGQESIHEIHRSW